MIRVYFNRKKQWLNLTIHNVHPTTFGRNNGTYWAYYEPLEGRKPRLGKFGHIHFVAGRVTEDAVAHELFHVIVDWMREKNIQITVRNEERLAVLFDEITRNFWKVYKNMK